jgi:DNA (cytosine-5)-methyltransferase 1
MNNSKKAQNPDLQSEYLNIKNEFTKAMREWPNFTNPGKKFTGHIIRKTPRDYNIFRYMPEGGMYPDAFKTALGLFEKKILEMELIKNRKILQGSKEWNEIYFQIVPPYSIDKYPNKFRKLWIGQPSRTLPAHIGKDSYSHIHFDSEQARGISLREAARIQSFPDGFHFYGSMNSRLKQIGNAVPPLLAYAVANNLKNQIQNTQI